MSFDLLLKCLTSNMTRIFIKTKLFLSEKKAKNIRSNNPKTIKISQRVSFFVYDFAV